MEKIEVVSMECKNAYLVIEYFDGAIIEYEFCNAFECHKFKMTYTLLSAKLAITHLCKTVRWLDKKVIKKGRLYGNKEIFYYNMPNLS